MSGNCKRLALLLLLTCSVWLPALAAVPAAMELDMGPGAIGDVSWASIEIRRQPRAESEPAWRAKLSGLSLAEALPVGDISLECHDFEWSKAGPDCRRGSLALPPDWLALDGELRFSLRPAVPAGYRLTLDHEQLAADVELGRDGGLVVELTQLDLGALGPLLAAWVDLSLIGGIVSGQGSQSADGWQASLAVEEMFFDTPDGAMAGEGVDLSMELALVSGAGNGPTELRLAAAQNGGELLFGPVYLPPPDAPLGLDLTMALHESGRIDLTRVGVEDPGAFEVAGSAVLVETGEGWQALEWQVDRLVADLTGLWPRWLDGPAAAAGFSGMRAEGGMRGQLSGDAEGRWRIDLMSEALNVIDPRERLSVQGLSAQLNGTERALRIGLEWDGVGLFGLELGASSARLHHDEVGLRLLDPVRMGLLDGAVVIDGLAALRVPDASTRTVLDARIEPLDLAALTRALELPELGGQLSGRFPGVTYSDDRLTFTGGIQIEAFSGHISLEKLVVERPLGSAPAVSAEVEFERLDLLELTGAFGFGRMEGQASGWARGLRLVNWRPVAMDARLFTHEDVPRRRISQRAVDNLSSLGGAGGAVISGTVLRVFDDFPYRRVGLACRLTNNICHIDGVAPHDSGGFLIVEGRGLPRLDIVGHRRLVDWPQFMGQLASMMDG